MNIRKQFKDGLITQNPVLVQLLGMCSVLEITTTLFNGIGMGVSVTFYLSARTWSSPASQGDTSEYPHSCVHSGYRGLCHNG